MDSKNISVVIQGPVYKDITTKCAQNVRTFLPKAEIIISTWEDANLDELKDVDIVVKSKDPGGYPVYDDPIVYHAANRQIVNTSAGLRKATRSLAIKMRSDMYFEHTNFLNYFNKYNKRSSEYKFLKNRVINSTSFAPNPYREPKPFHPSDWFFFGLTEDLINIFDIPLCPEPETSRWFETNKRPKIKEDSYYPIFCRYPTEQYIWVAFLRKYIDLDFKHTFDIENNNIKIAEKIFANNLVLVDAQNLGYNSYKYSDFYKWIDLSRMYTEREWLKLYQKYCDPNIRLPLFDREKIRRFQIFFRKYVKDPSAEKKNFKRHLKLLFGIPFGSLVKWE